MHDTTKRISGIGAGILATAAGAAAGYYFYVSKDASKNRRIVAAWANDLKRDVIRMASTLPALDRAAIIAIVDQAAQTYESVRGVRRADLERAARELKDNWQSLARELRRAYLATPATSASTSARKRARHAPRARKSR